MLTINYLLLSFLTSAVYGKRPNFVVILTDDQDEVLGGMTPMRNVEELIGREGVTFTNSYTNSPICCPSRASFLTGKYVHNHHTYNNSLPGGCYGESWRHHHEKNTFASILQKNGYETFYMGKYLNQYGTEAAGGPTEVPPGWTEWHGLVGNSVYYNYTISNNGVPSHSTDMYLTDIISYSAVNFIETRTKTAPFLMVLAPPAPHEPFTPAPRHQGAFANVTVMKNPSFNVSVGADDKHWLMKMPPSPLPSSMEKELSRVYRSRWEALLAVDEMVAGVIAALIQQGLLNNTYIVYTSDNGYHMGQFSQAYDKRQPYETDIKVPLLIRGPDLPKNSINKQPVLNIDIGPTILQIADISQWMDMDGRPIQFENSGLVKRDFLIEYHGEANRHSVDQGCPWKYDGELSQCHMKAACKCQDSKNNTFACVRSFGEDIDMKYCTFFDGTSDDFYDHKNKMIDGGYFTEIYDLTADPHELTNILFTTFPYIREQFWAKYLHLHRCKGYACNITHENEGGKEMWQNNV